MGQEQSDTNKSIEKRLKHLEDVGDGISIERRLEELENFKRKVEVGSWLIRCGAYFIGGIVVFITGFLTIFEKWPFK